MIGDNTQCPRRKASKGKGRLVRSLEFTPSTLHKSTRRLPRNNTTNNTINNTKNTTSIWRDPIKNVILPSGFTTHKMSSVTNNFMSSDLISSSVSEIDEMVGELVDPGSGTLVFPQHDEVFRTSPLSTSSFNINDNDNDNERDIDDIYHDNTHDKYKYHDNINDKYHDNTNDKYHDDTNDKYHDNTHDNLHIQHGQNDASVGMSWNQKQNKWVPLIYRYVFPSSAFAHNTTSTTTQPSPSPKSVRTASFSFPPPKKSIMMGPDGFKTRRIDSEARDVCEKLLELMDDENLMLPVVKVSPRASSPPASSSKIHPGNKSLISEWSSLPSSPPPPIFHDVCNRPIPELRLSPPMSGKSIGKRLFPLNATINNYQTNQNNNSNCESPLTKRLRFSSSSSSIS